MKRKVQTLSSDEDESSEESNFDDSDAERPKLFKHRQGPIKLPKVAQVSTDSDSDPPARCRWSVSCEADQGARKTTSSGSALAPTMKHVPVTSPVLPTKSPPVFGVPPFSVR